MRELENALERAMILTPGEPTIELGALPERVTRTRAEPLVADRARRRIPTLEAIERAYIMWVLQSEGGNKTRAAEIARHRSVDAASQALAVRSRDVTYSTNRIPSSFPPLTADTRNAATADASSVQPVMTTAVTPTPPRPMEGTSAPVEIGPLKLRASLKTEMMLSLAVLGTAALSLAALNAVVLETLSLSKDGPISWRS